MVIHDEGTSDIPLQPATLATSQRKALRLQAPSAIWAQSLLHHQDGSCRSNPTPANLLKGGRHIPASRGCRSRHRHSAKRYGQTPELYLLGGDIYSHWRAVPPLLVYA